jgi:hypothetical protein
MFEIVWCILLVPEFTFLGFLDVMDIEGPSQNSPKKVASSHLFTLQAGEFRHFQMVEPTMSIMCYEAFPSEATLVISHS